MTFASGSVETTSDVSDVESRLMALTDQLQRRQTEAQRLKVEHKRLSKEKLRVQETALIKQIEVNKLFDQNPPEFIRN